MADATRSPYPRCCFVGLMLLHGLHSAEVVALNRDDVLFSEGQIRIHSKGTKMRLPPLAIELHNCSIIRSASNVLRPIALRIE